MHHFSTTLAAGLILSAFPAIGQSTNGRNVNLVVFGTFDGRELGAYVQMSSRTWIERSRGGGTPYNFDEVNRDEWSVYLLDRSRDVRIQLDLFTKKIMYSDSNPGSRRELYQVRDASSRMTGWLVSRVDYGDGSGRISGTFESRERGLWTEVNAEDRFRFREVNRDDWSVYLEDRSRNVAIQLDLHTRKVMYKEIGDRDRRQIYTIEDAR